MSYRDDSASDFLTPESLNSEDEEDQFGIPTTASPSSRKLVRMGSKAVVDTLVRDSSLGRAKQGRDFLLRKRSAKNSPKTKKSLDGWTTIRSLFADPEVLPALAPARSSSGASSVAGQLAPSSIAVRGVVPPPSVGIVRRKSSFLNYIRARKSNIMSVGDIAQVKPLHSETDRRVASATVAEGTEIRAVRELERRNGDVHRGGSGRMGSGQRGSFGIGRGASSPQDKADGQHDELRSAAPVRSSGDDLAESEHVKLAAAKAKARAPNHNRASGFSTQTQQRGAWQQQGVSVTAVNEVLRKDSGVFTSAEFERAIASSEAGRSGAIHPASLFRRGWDTLIILLGSAVVFFQPLDCAFGTWGTVYAAFFVVDLFFIVDVYIRSITARRERHGEITYSLMEIRKYYFWSGEMVMDIFFSLPLDVMVWVAAGGSSGTMTTIAKDALQVVKLVKLGRLLRCRRAFEDLQEANMLRGYALLCEIEGGSDSTYVYTTYEETWTHQQGVHSMDRASILERYFAMLYVAFLMLIGENTEPRTTPERVFILFVMIFGAVLYSFMFGNIALLISNINRTQSRFQELMDQTSEHMRNLQLPAEVQDRVRLYYAEQWRLNRCLDRQSFLSGLSASLSAEVSLVLHGEMVQKVPFFSSVKADCLVALVQQLESSLFLPGDYVIREGEIGVDMHVATAYFLRKGLCEVLKRGNPQVLHVLHAGSYFGEIAMARGIRRTAMIRAATFCDTSRLTIDSLERIIDEFPDSGRKIHTLIEAKLKTYNDKSAKEALRQLEERRLLKQKFHKAAGIAKVISRMSIGSSGNPRGLVHQLEGMERAGLLGSNSGDASAENSSPTGSKQTNQARVSTETLLTHAKHAAIGDEDERNITLEEVIKASARLQRLVAAFSVQTMETSDEDGLGRDPGDTM